MNRILAILTLATLLVLEAAMSPTDMKATIRVGSANRTYYVHLPLTMGLAMPLVLDFHGAGVTQERNLRQQGLDALADSRSFIVVYPRGVKMRWNDGRAIDPDAADDFGFVAQLIKVLTAKYPVDTHRIYAVGFSNGATFVNALACHLPNTFAAIATVSGTIPDAVKSTCDSPVSALLIGGTADPLMPYGGGELATPGLPSALVTSVDETLAIRTRLAGCKEISDAARLAPLNPNDNTWISERHGIACTAGYDVSAYTVHGGGHSWPGAPSPRASKQLNASETIIGFLLAHHLF